MNDKQTWPTKPIMIAGLLGGLLGGVASFAASRMIVPIRPGAYEPKQTLLQPSEAQGLIDGLLVKLKENKNAEFIAEVKKRLIFLNKNEFDQFQQKFEESRDVYQGLYGSATGEFELVSETILRPQLVRFVYLEKFARGAVVWFFVLLHDGTEWRLNGIVWNKDLIHAFPGGS